MNNLLEINDLKYSVKSQGLFNAGIEKVILKNINFAIREKEIVGITGESGSGKTTLIKIIAGINKPTSGIIHLNFGEDRNAAKANPIQLLFQNNSDILNPLRKVDDIVGESILHNSKDKLSLEIEKTRIFDLIGFNNDLRNRKGFELSGGERQRAALARILAAKPELLILDEPFSAQDADSQLILLNLFKKINVEFGLTMICVAHNLKLLKKLADRIIVMYNGEIAESGTTKEIFDYPQNDYTKFLLKCENYDMKYEELKFSKSN
ncbi:MAG: ATP-binding cassette domain-containing protein [Candidatus Aquicultor sp.]